MGAAIECDRADRRAGVDAEKRGFAVDLGPNQQMILGGANQRQRLILESAGLRRPKRRRDRCENKQGRAEKCDNPSPE